MEGKQKRYLRSQAHNMRPVFQIGKDGLSTEWLKQVEEAVEKRELIKVNILQNSIIEPEEVVAFLAEHSKIEVVQVIGHVLVLYKKSSKPKNRHYSLEVEAL